MPGQDYYDILGVARDASGDDIKKAFRQIARECHPDRAGDDPVLAERYKAARAAYETLSDPVTRGRYDRRGQRRAAAAGGSFFDAFYRATERNGRNKSGPSYGNSAAGGHASTRGARNNPNNNLDLDDLFNDFGDFGFGGPSSRPPKSSGYESRESPPTSHPEPGDDIEIDLEVPADVASNGGSVTAVYYRNQRADSWRPGADDPGLVRIQDIADIRILPGTGHGEVLRERGLGHAGPHGGSYGDLCIRVVVRREAPRSSGTPSSAPAAGGETVVEISVVEALLGGRVEVTTPAGKVRVSIPSGTSSDARLRLKGKGEFGADGAREDLYVRVRIVVPKNLDDESRALVEEFGRLNPGNPRDDG